MSKDAEGFLRVRGEFCGVRCNSVAEMVGLEWSREDYERDCHRA